MSENPGNGKSYRHSFMEDELIRFSRDGNHVVFVLGEEGTVTLKLSHIHQYTISGYVRDRKTPQPSSERVRYNKDAFSWGFLTRDRNFFCKSVPFHSGKKRETPGAAGNWGELISNVDLRKEMAFDLMSGHTVCGKILAMEQFMIKMDVQGSPVWVFKHAITGVEEKP